MTSKTTTPEKIEIPEGFVKSRDGSIIHKTQVKDIDKQRDKVMMKIIKRGKQISGELATFKDETLNAVLDFADFSAKQYNAKMGGKKGSMTLFTFDGLYKIELAVSENRAFDERLQVAKSLIDECIQEWMKGSNQNIKALVQDAFKVDKQGQVSVERILGLRRLKIEDERWTNAMAAIADSIQITGSKRYVRLYELDEDTGEYVRISLDAASV